jgi:hypothetical protein
MNDIATWFLILSLFLPRLALIIAWCTSGVPANTIPFWGDFFMTLFLPRILILIYIITNMGFGGWAVAHLIFAIIAYTSNTLRVSMKQARTS